MSFFRPSFRRIFQALLIFSFSHVEGYLDVETLPGLRTKRYSTGTYDKVLVYSAPRTGSSLVYNVLRFLFERGQYLSQPHNAFHPGCLVLKTHLFKQMDQLKNENVLYIVTLRDPIEASISFYRIGMPPVKNLQLWCKGLMEAQAERLRSAERKKEEGFDVFFLKHEDFTKDLDFLFDFIEKTFSISIEEADKTIMRAGYSRENIYANTLALSDFTKFLPLSGFHGQHIALERFIPPDNIRSWLNGYFLDVLPLFQKYGYSVEILSKESD
jgi:hypothetical protein